MTELQINRMKHADRLLSEVDLTYTEGTCTSDVFDAGYLYVLAALNAPPGGEHPSRDVLNNASARFNLNGEGIHSAISFVELQYSRTFPSHLFPQLLVWARDMKQLSERLGGAS